MPAAIIWKQGDTQPSFADTLQYSDGTVPPLGGNTTLALRIRSLSDAALMSATGVVKILDPNQGSVLYTPSANDTAVPGNYVAEWVVTFDPVTGLGQQTFPTDGYIWLSVEPNLSLAPQGVVALPVVKKVLNIQDNDHSRDAELLDIIQSVAPLVEAETGPIVPKLYDEWYDGGSPTIALHHDPSAGFGSNPYLQVVAASEYRGPVEYPLALVASPALGSIYSLMVVPQYATVTRRTAAGRTLAFMPGHESVHIVYKSGQNPIPAAIQRATIEYVRTLYRWPQQTGQGSLSPADRMELGAAFQSEVSRIVRTWLRPLGRYPSIA